MLQVVDRFMEKGGYVNFGNLKQSAEKLGLGCCCIVVFQQCNDPKHTTLWVKNYLHNKVSVSDLPVQSPVLNRIINLWGELKTKVHVCKPSNLLELERCAKEGCAGIPQDTCVRLVFNHNK